MNRHIQNGTLADIAPTILSALKIKQPPSMLGSNLVSSITWRSPQKVILIILDGWGLGASDNSNPIYLAQTPVWNELQRYPSSQLKASGESVGLRPGMPGNSEAGHITIGAGRVVMQDDVRLEIALKDGTFFKNPVFLKAIQHTIKNNSSLHLIGMLSENSSHGLIEYPLALTQLAKQQGCERVFLHMIFDGRSTSTSRSIRLLEMMENKLEELGIGQIVSGIGREWALDRDKDYSKTERAYNALVFGDGDTF